MNRRRFLAFGAAGATLLGCGGALSWFRLGYGLAPGDVPIGLSEKQLAVVRAICEAVAPAEDGFEGALALGVHQRIDEEIWAAAPDDADDLRAAIELLEHLPPIFGFPGRLTRLTPEDRAACYQAFLRAGPTVVVQAAIGLKQMVQLFTYVEPATWAPIHYDGPWVRTAVPPDSAVRYAQLLAAGRSP